MNNDDTRRMIYGTIVVFLLFLVFWISFVYISACGFTLTCNRGAPLVVRTPVPTLIPVKQAQAQPTPIEFDKECRVAATDLIAAWISAGHPETESFLFTDLSGRDCEGTFADIQPLFVENSLWFPGSLGCTSCHNADLTERSKGLDLSSYQAISLGTRRVKEATSPGTDIFGDGDLEKSLLYQVLTKQGLTTQGHSPDAEPPQKIIYAGKVVTESEVVGTPTATPTP
ncbi:MAG TPA: hypothetical protein VHP14_05620 [Anaerolineales bacterium]|nr:hypothetical protein [Anaerolineales bacterium]